MAKILAEGILPFRPHPTANVVHIPSLAASLLCPFSGSFVPVTHHIRVDGKDDRVVFGEAQDALPL